MKIELPNIEIEKKYIIRKPCEKELSEMPEYTRSEITQIYLKSSASITHRIRSREKSGNITYTETTKVRIDKMSAYEDEREISCEEFEMLSSERDEKTQPIIKTRHTFVYEGQLFEIDIYPEWKSTAIMETELESRDKDVIFPKIITVLREVTGDKNYSNAGMSRSFPNEDK